MEKQFLVVRDYIEHNPGMDIETISKDTGVEVKSILQMLREGRLQYKGSGRLKCTICGASIDEGYFCIGCRQEIQKRFQVPLGEEIPQSSGLDYTRSGSLRGNVFHTRQESK